MSTISVQSLDSLDSLDSLEILEEEIISLDACNMHELYFYAGIEKKMYIENKSNLGTRLHLLFTFIESSTSDEIEMISSIVVSSMCRKLISFRVDEKTGKCLKIKISKIGNECMQVQKDCFFYAIQ